MDLENSERDSANVDFSRMVFTKQLTGFVLRNGNIQYPVNKKEHIVTPYLNLNPKIKQGSKKSDLDLSGGAEQPSWRRPDRQ